MAKKLWEVNVDGIPHTVELEHGYWSGKREIRVDGTPIVLPRSEEKKFFDTGSVHDFSIGDHKLTATIRTNGLTCSYDLLVDGVSHKTGKATVTDPKSMKPSLRWSISPEEYDWQIDHEKELKFTQTYRGQVIVFFAVIQTLTLLFSFFLPEILAPSDAFTSLVLYLICLFFVYRGYRAALIVLFLFWTFDKAYTFMLSLEGAGTPVGSIVFWILGSLLILKTLRIENERKRRHVTAPLMSK